MAPNPAEHRPNETGELQRKRLLGMLLGRLVLALFSLVLTVIVQVWKSESVLAAQLEPLYAFSSILFVYTIVGALSLKRVRNLSRFAHQQLLFDIAAVTCLVYLSGGVDSLFSFLYMPVIIAAAVLLGRSGSFWIAALSGVAYGLLLDLQYFRWLRPLYLTPVEAPTTAIETYFYSLLMALAAFFVTAYGSGYLTEELERSRLQVAHQRRDLARIERLHQHIVRSMTSGLLTLDGSGIVISANPEAQRLLAGASGTLIGSQIHDLVPDIGELIRATQITGADRVERREFLYRVPAGEPLCLGCTLSALRMDSDEPLATGWVVNFQDLTKIKKMEEHLRRQEKMALAGKVAAEIVHEIKNPLASMSGAVQLLAADLGADPLHRRLTGIVSREIERIDQLVTNFLWLARGSLNLHPQSVALAEGLREVAELMRSRHAADSAGRLRLGIEDEPLAWIDPDHFRQIVWNLVLNGLEAMPQGGDLNLRLTRNEGADTHPAEACLEVQDQGPGIPEELKERIFEPFFTTKRRGTGLGLSIVYQLLDQAGGRLEVDSVVGLGTSFRIFFPLSCVLPLVKPVRDGYIALVKGEC